MLVKRIKKMAHLKTNKMTYKLNAAKPKICVKRTNISYLPYCFDIYRNKPLQWQIKRFLDFILALIALFLLSPLMLLTAIAIKLDSKGPVFFKQKRIGFLGKEFYMYKFRSMKIDAEKNLQALLSKNETNNKMFKMFNDPRVTSVGKFIRKFSIDELPQLFNVLKGEMSLVGFRPPLPKEVEKYHRRHFIRFSTMPGITGIWQVSGRSKIKDFEKVIDLEKKYMLGWNFVDDIIIMFRTIPVVLLADGAA